MPRRELVYSTELVLRLFGLNPAATLLDIELQHRRGQVSLILDDPDWPVPCLEGCIPPVEAMDEP